jgi:Zn-finger nucleic acid-binding protein
MQCLVCEDQQLSQKFIDNNLEGFFCSKCCGIWIQAKAYWNFIHSLNTVLPEKPESETLNVPVYDTSIMKICPDCGHFLTKRKVGHGLDFHIDRCQCCGGVWLDKNEWDVLKSRNLHDVIHLIFSQEWQEEILHEEEQKAYESEIEILLGQEDYNILRSFTERFKHSPRKHVVLAYVQNSLIDKEKLND